MKKRISFTISAMLTVVMMAGCGETVTVDPGRNIELVEPVNASVDNMETVYRRNLYDAKVYEAYVYPYVEEYGFEDKSYEFDRFGAYPGDVVKKGDVLIYTNAADLDVKIESMQARLQKLTDTQQDYCAKADEKLATLQEDLAYAEEVLENLTEYIEEGVTSYPGNLNADFKKWTGTYKKAELDINVLNVEREETTALYQLEYAFYNEQLQELLEEKKASVLYSGMDGQVVAIQTLGANQKITLGKPMVAVADMSQKFIKCEYIDERLVKAAHDVYVLIGGERFEVTYQETEDERCSTFVLHDENDEAAIGDYAILVYMSKGAKDVLTLSNEAIHQDVSKKYVHILVDGKVTSREIKTGISDGMFTEILSGLEEGDQVVVGDVLAPGANTAVLTREDNFTEYKYVAEMYYPIYDYVRNTNTNVTTYFGEYLVPVYQDVKKGDPIVRITVEADLRALDEKETELKREKERLADYIEANKENIETNESIANRITTWQETVDTMEEAVIAMREEYTSTTLVSPIDGKVETLYMNTEFDEMFSGQPCGTIVDTSVGFLTAESKGFINYGTELQVTYTTLDNMSARCTGVVVTMGELGVSEAFNTSGVLIKLPDGVVDNLRTHTMMATSGWYKEEKIGVSGVGKVMEDVVKIPSDAVTDIDGKTYVNVLLEDGTVKVVPFLSGGHSRSFYWAIEGLDEGMTICW